MLRMHPMTHAGKVGANAGQLCRGPSVRPHSLTRRPFSSPTLSIVLQWLSDLAGLHPRDILNPLSLNLKVVTCSSHLANLSRNQILLMDAAFLIQQKIASTTFISKNFRYCIRR